MPSLSVSLTSLALVLWSGMLIIAGSIWVLSSQVRKLADLIEAQAKLQNQPKAEAPRVAHEPGRDRVLRMVEGNASRAR